MISRDRICGIGAHTLDNAYGNGNEMPWPRTACTKDMARFKEVTSVAAPGMMNILICGRVTGETMRMRPLPRRKMIVVSSGYPCFDQLENGLMRTRSIEGALETAGKLPNVDKIFFIGGLCFWEAAIEYGSRFYITVVRRSFPGDVGIARLKMPLAEQAIAAGFSQVGNSEVIADAWDEPVKLEFLEYAR